MYCTLAKACENVNVDGSKPYTWSDCEQGRGNIGYKMLSLAHTCLGKDIRYVSDMGTQELAKREIVTS